MKSIATLFFSAAACLAAGCEVQRPGTISAAAPAAYRLTVTFPSGATVRTSALPATTFGGTAMDKNGNGYAIGGMVSPANGSAAQMLLTVAESLTDGKQNGMEAFTFNVNVPLGQDTPVGGSMCTVRIDP